MVTSSNRSVRIMISYFLHRQKLMDGATPIVVIDTDDILQSLQRATLRNKEAAQQQNETKQQTARNHMNGSA